VPVPPDKTARVFAKLGAPPLEATCVEPLVLPTQVETTEELIALMRAEGNDLAAAAAAIVPFIADVQAAMAPLPACMAVCLSGAGPTCFGVFPGAEEALSAAAQLGRSHPGWWVQPSILGP
jgi:4-diphosphocytidyl-2-C-methyl-D-erythritol kinase